jgi:hypothetical protein
MSDENNVDANLEKLTNKTSSSFEMNGLDFDIETGVITAYSTQSEKCYVLFSFINEDTNEAVQNFKCEVEAGNCIITEKTIDTKDLPEYFMLEAKLVDKNDKVLCDAFHVDTYTKIMQEIADTDIHDFDEDRVVNFDESEDTNFIVLSDDAIKLESTDTENSLVSADFDSNTFVFEHIDESIQYLNGGDFLYVQPDEENIIAIAVENVDIEGDTATVTGSDDIDDMLAFVKFEATGDMKGATIDTLDSDDGFVFPGHENEEQFTLDENKPVEFMYNSRKPISLNMKTSATLPLGGGAPDPNEYKSDHVSFDIGGSIGFTVKLNFCKKWTYSTVDFNLSFDVSFSISASIKAGTEEVSPKEGKALSEKLRQYDNFITDEEKEMLGKKLKVDIPTSIPGIKVVTTVNFIFNISGKISLTIKYTPEVGFKANSKTGSFDPFKKTGTDALSVDFTVEGTIFIGIEISPSVVLISDKVARAGLKFTFGLEFKASRNNEPNISNDPEDEDCYYPISDDGKVAIYNSSENKFHSCNGCYYGSSSLVFKIGYNLKLLNKNLTANISLFELKIPLSCFDFYFVPFGKREFGKRKDYNGDGKQTCPHYKYKTVFNLYDVQRMPLEGVSIKVDGVENVSDRNGYAQFYCDNGEYSYVLSYNGTPFKTDTICVDNSVKTVNLMLETKMHEDGTVEVLTGEATENVDIKYTTAATTTTTTQPVPTTTTAFVDNKDDEMLEAEQLGDNVWGIIYSDGGMYIYGSGDMYSDKTLSFANIKTVKTVVFDDVDPESGEYITSIGNGLFKGAENLETVYLSNEITKIGDDAFNGCKSLKYFRYGGEKDTTETFVLPSKLRSIGNSAFSGCSSAEFGDIVFNTNVNVIGSNAFRNCTKIESITVESENAVIKDNAFFNCINTEELTLASFDFAKDLTLGVGGFLGADKNDDSYVTNYDICVPLALKTINIKGGTIIPYRAFYGMKELEKITLPEGLTQIDAESFMDCSNAYIEGQKIFDNVEKIGQQAFQNCSKAEFGNIVFTDKTKVIDNFAFINCHGITSIKIEGEDTKVGQQAFMNCIKNTEADINIVNGTIGKEAFRNNNSLEKITFASLNWFENSDTDIEGILASDDTEYTYPVQYGLYVPKSLKTINIKSGTIIPYRTFYGMKQLEEISLPKGIETIDGQAFYDCSGLKTIYFSEDIKLVERSAFHGCSRIEEVNYEGSDEQWDNIIIEDDNDPILRKNGKVNFNVPLWVKGDANGDGEIDMSDIVLIMQALANPNKYGINGTDPTHITENGFKYGDINGDGLTVNDAVRIQEYLLGKISSLA